MSLITVSGFLFMGALRRLTQDKKMDALIKVITEERNEFHEWARETANETAAREERHNEQLEKLNGAFTNLETRVDGLLDTVKDKSQSDK